MKRAINRISFILTWACLTALVAGAIYGIKNKIFVEGFASAFFGWAIIFAIINACTRVKHAVKYPPPDLGATPEPEKPAQ